MQIVRKCPACNSSKIKGAVQLQNGMYVQSIVCLSKKCRYSNHRPIGSATRY